MMKNGMTQVLVVIMFFAQSAVQAQPDSTLVHSVDIKNLPYFAYGTGLGITSPDSLYQLNIRFRMQNRISMDLEQGEVDRVEARVRRLRLRFDGFVYHPTITYTIQLSFSTEDVQDYIEDNPPNILRDAMIYYHFRGGWIVGFGQAKLPGNRERVNSSGALQLADRSSANAIFNIDRDFGLQAFYHNSLRGNFIYIAKVAVTSGEGRNWLSSPGLHLSYTGRLEFLPFGYFENNGDYFQGDLAREQQPKLSLAVAYNYNHEALRSAGQRGDLLFESRTINNLIADLILKYRGWAWMAEFMRRRADNPLTFDPQEPTNVVFVLNGTGFVLQGSYLWHNNWELVGRYSRVMPADEIRTVLSFQHTDSYTMGINKYFRGHNLKLQTDATYLSESAAGNLSDRSLWNFRFQIELGI